MLTPLYVTAPAQKKNFIVFQLVKVSLSPEDKKIEELDVQALPNVACGVIENTYTNRIQTGRAFEAYSYSHAGEGIQKMTISGTFGGPNHLIRQGLAYIDGYTALIAFVERMFRASVARDDDLGNIFIEQADAKQINMTRDKEMLVVNMFDFDLHIKKQVALRSLQIVRDPNQGLAHRFTLQLDLLGDAVFVGSMQTENGWLAALFMVEDITAKMFRSLQNGYAAVFNNPIIKEIAAGVDIADAFLEAIPAVLSATPAVVSTLSGKAIMSVGKEIPGPAGRFFSSIDQSRSSIVNQVVSPFKALLNS